MCLLGIVLTGASPSSAWHCEPRSCTRAHVLPSACHCKPRSCTRAHVLPSACHCEERGSRPATWQSASPQKCLASWLLFGQIRTHLPSLSLRTSAHTGVAIRSPRRGAWQVSCCLGKFAHTYQVCHCEPVRTLAWQSASPQRSLASWLLFGQIRTHLPSLSLRTSAHTGVAIRIPAEEPGKSVVLRANSSCFSYLPKVFLFVLWYCKEYGLPRRFAPRNDRGEVSSRPSALQPLTRICLLHGIARHVLAPAHTSFLLHGIARHVLATADALLSSACHCEPVRTLVRQSASPQKCLASWLLFGQIRRAFRIRPKYCFSFRAAAGERIATSLRSSQ